jgi:hypothetical protein
MVTSEDLKELLYLLKYIRNQAGRGTSYESLLKDLKNATQRTKHLLNNTGDPEKGRVLLTVYNRLSSFIETHKENGFDGSDGYIKLEEVGNQLAEMVSLVSDLI